MQIDNIYFLLAVIAAVIGVVTLFWFILRSGKSVSISKDGLSVYTKQGNFLNKEKVDADIFIMNDSIKIEEFITDKPLSYTHYRQDGAYGNIQDESLKSLIDRQESIVLNLKRSVPECCKDCFM